MAVSPPLDRIPKIPSTIISSLSEIIANLIFQLSDQVSQLEILANTTPKNLGCNDQRTQQIKEQVALTNELLSTLQQLKRPLIAVVTSFQLLGNIASAIKIGILAVSVPVPAIASEAVALQNQTISNALASANQIQGLLSSIDSLGVPFEQSLGSIANLLGILCPEEPITVSQNTQIASQAEQQVNSLNEQLAESLSQQENLLVDLVDPATEVFRGISDPNPSQGKLGDFYIQTDSRTIFGPKPNFDDWGTGQKY